jgi:diguanylate cyclase (GGDEF)-like protein
LVRPTVHSLHLTGIGKVVAVAWWVGDTVIVAAAIRMLIVWPRNVAARLLAAAILALFAGGIFYALGLIRGTWNRGGPADLCLLAFTGLCGAAAAVPSMAGVGAAQDIRQGLGAGRLSALAAGLLLAPSALLVEATRGPVRTPVAIGVVSLAVGALAVWRLAIAVAGQRRAVARDAVLRRTGHAIGLATTRDGVLAALTAGLVTLTGDPGATARLHDRTATVEEPGRRVQLRVPVVSDGENGSDPSAGDHVVGDLVFAASVADLAELDDVLSGIGEHAAVALQRIELVARVRESEREQDILAYRASHDALTGLANGELFRQRLRADSHAAGPGTTTAVVFIDLDDFKTINDTLGHEAGDGVLVAAAQRIDASLRDGDLAARLGGDEFAALLPDIDDTSAYAIAVRITDVLALPTTVAGFPIRCRASVGVATAQTDDVASIMRQADTALYAAKADGKGRWRAYEPTMTNPLHRRTDVRNDPRGAHSPPH